MKQKSFTISILLLSIFLVWSCSPSETQEKPPKLYTVNQFMDIVQINGGAFSSDESKIVYNSKAIIFSPITTEFCLKICIKS